MDHVLYNFEEGGKRGEVGRFNILAMLKNSNASQLFDILMGIEDHIKKKDVLGLSMVSYGLSLLYKTENHNCSQRIHFRP